MKALSEYINEHKKSSSHPVFKCSQTNEEIDFNDIIEYVVSDNQQMEWLFDRLSDGEFENYVIHTAHWALGNVLVVDTETSYKFEIDHITNVDDDRDMYDLKSLQRSADIDGIVLMKD